MTDIPPKDSLMMSHSMQPLFSSHSPLPYTLSEIARDLSRAPQPWCSARAQSAS